MGLLETVRTRAMAILDRLQWLAPLVGRLAVGLLFMLDGWAKLHHLDTVTQFFDTLHIPAPGFNALLVASSQLVCGALLVVGLATRLATFPLIMSMIVAILTAKLKELAPLHGVYEVVYGFVGFDEFTYLCVLVMLVVLGPGEVALDTLVARKLGWQKAS
jgi:putative oxidoreductase